MKLYNDLTLKFERPQWRNNTEFALIDTILERHPELLALLAADIMPGNRPGNFGRRDTPSVEQIVRAAIFKEMRGMDYRELEFAQSDSRSCAAFIKLDERKPFSFQMFQKYISRISPESLQTLLYEINKIAISEGLEDLTSLRQDSTVVKSNIHYPTNNALVWDCIKESHRLLEYLQKECGEVSFRDYRKSAKQVYYKINVTKSKDARVDLFVNSWPPSPSVSTRFQTFSRRRSKGLNDDPFHDSEIGNISSSLNTTKLPYYQYYPYYKQVETELSTGIILRLARATY